MRTPRESILISLELLLILSHIARILIEEHLQGDTHQISPDSMATRAVNTVTTHSPIRLPEPHHPPLGVLKLVRGQLQLVNLHDGVPQLLVLLLQHDDQARGLGVEGAGDVLDGVGDELFDAGVGDGGLVGELVVGAAGFGEVEQGLGVCHCGWCCCCCCGVEVGGGVCLLRGG